MPQSPPQPCRYFGLSRFFLTRRTPLPVSRSAHRSPFAALMGGVFYQLRGKDPVTGRYMVTSAVVQLVTGAGLIWTLTSLDLPVVDAKMWVKLALDALVAVTALAGVRNRRSWAFYAVGTFTATAAVVAVA
ncbi:hypothetical protein [Streptomyces sp. NPDC049944]|uniref:hypothetical protein n=1 Tax=Streptomyces sp. NPDC049944 TaxID=3155657 RepID=UPI00342D30BA